MAEPGGAARRLRMVSVFPGLRHRRSPVALRGRGDASGRRGLACDRLAERGDRVPRTPAGWAGCAVRGCRPEAARTCRPPSPRRRGCCARRPPDVVVTSNWGAIEWAMAARLCGFRHVHTEDGFGPEERQRQIPRRAITRRLALRGSDVVLPLAHAVHHRDHDLAAAGAAAALHPERHRPAALRARRAAAARRHRGDRNHCGAAGGEEPFPPHRGLRPGARRARRAAG